MYEERQAPVREGEEYEVEIESMGEKGDGIAKIKGFVIFVAGTKKGDFVKVRIKKVLKNVGFGESLEKKERPARERRFVTVRQEELARKEEPRYEEYEDTEDFGEELEKE